MLIVPLLVGNGTWRKGTFSARSGHADWATESGTWNKLPSNAREWRPGVAFGGGQSQWVGSPMAVLWSVWEGQHGVFHSNLWGCKSNWRFVRASFMHRCVDVNSFGGRAGRLIFKDPAVDPEHPCQMTPVGRFSKSTTHGRTTAMRLGKRCTPKRCQLKVAHQSLAQKLCKKKLR